MKDPLEEFLIGDIVYVTGNVVGNTVDPDVFWVITDIHASYSYAPKGTKNGAFMDEYQALTTPIYEVTTTKKICGMALVQKLPKYMLRHVDILI